MRNVPEGIFNGNKKKMAARKNHWLNKQRIKNYSYIFFCIFAFALFLRFYSGIDNFDPQGRPLGSDFTSFYATAKLAVEGHGADAYDFSKHFIAEKAAVGEQLDMYFSFSYPPTFMLILAPLAYLPYLPAFFVWIALTLIFYATMIRKIVGRNEAIMLALAFPAVFWTIGHGQNALLTAGLLAGGLYFLERKPILAGILIGLLSFKPHLGILIPFVLMAAGHWRVFTAAAITTIIFAALSWLVFGTDVWMAFFQSIVETKSTLNEGLVPFHKMQSFYAGLRNAGISVEISYFSHALYALSTAAAVIWIWRQDIDIRLKKASLCIGTLLMSPFMLSYDLTLLAVAIAFLADYSITKHFQPSLINLLCIIWVSPFIITSISMLIPLPWTPLLLSLLLYQIILLCRLKISEKLEIND